MRRFGALLVMLALLIFTAAWTWEDCVEVDFDHPDCDQYTTTTTQPATTTTAEVTTTTAEVTTTTQEVTTTTEGNGTTTTTPNQTTTTGTPPTTVPAPTTTVPFDSVPTTTVQFFDTTTAPQITTEETLPFTGDNTSAMVGLGVSLAVAGGLLLLGTRSRKVED